VARLPPLLRDQAIAVTCLFICRKHSGWEPYETAPGQGFDLTYEEIVEICDMLQLAERDDYIYMLIRAIGDTVADKRREKYTQQQLTEIASRLEKLYGDKFPSRRFIQHEGFRVVAQAQVARCRRQSGQKWSELAEEARQIRNVSDRIYVLGTVAQACPSKDRAKAREILKEAINLCTRIPSGYDRMERLSALASMGWDVDQASCREALKSAMALPVADDDDVLSVKRDIVDRAYRLDPEFATSLVALMDNDPARLSARVTLRQRLDVLETRRAMAEQGKSKKEIKKDPEEYPRAAWMLLGSLNAGRLGHRPPETIREYVQEAARLPIAEGYPILAWAIGNAVQRFGNTNEAIRFLRPVFEATVTACGIAARLAGPSARVRCLPEAFAWTDESEGQKIMIRAGEREDAIQRIKEWIEHEAEEFIKICDPFFGPADLEALLLILSAKPSLSVRVLTSLKHQEQEGIEPPLDAAYRNYWHRNVSDQDPPDTEIVVAGTRNKHELPIHDRWWITRGSGLRMGTSFRSLGLGKDSELSRLAADEAEVFEKDVDRYLDRKEKEHLGEKILYVLFTLA
jgi:hypothetical protein